MRDERRLGGGENEGAAFARLGLALIVGPAVGSGWARALERRHEAGWGYIDACPPSDMGCFANRMAERVRAALLTDARQG